MAHLASTACSRCRSQKLRCSRELPICERCARLHTPCAYPAPPDRKALAAFRAHPRSRRRNHGKPTRANHNQQSDSHLSTSPSHSIQQGDNLAGAGGPANEDNDLQLPQAVHQLLQEVYFTCMFNSTLIFHRPTFTQSFEEKNVPQHTLLAMYASATM